MPSTAKNEDISDQFMGGFLIFKALLCGVAGALVLINDLMLTSNQRPGVKK